LNGKRKVIVAVIVPVLSIYKNQYKSIGYDFCWISVSCNLHGFQGGALALPIDTKLFKSSMYSPRMTDVFSCL
jgi:hypothetical protein